LLAMRRFLFAVLFILLTASLVGGSHVRADYLFTTVNVGSNPNGVAFDSANGYIYVVNSASTSAPGTVSVINGATNKWVTDVTVGLLPEGAAFDSGNGYVYVTNNAAGTVSVISGTAVVATISLPSPSSPFGIAYDAFNGYVYVANYAGSISVISSTTVVDTILYYGSPFAPLYGIAVDLGNRYIYVGLYDEPIVLVIDGSTNTWLQDVVVGNSPRGIAFNWVNGYVYVANSKDNTVSVISGTTVTNTIACSGSASLSNPTAVAFDIVNGYIYVTNNGAGTVSVISGTSCVGSSVKVGNYPNGIAVDSTNGYIYVSNSNDNTVSVIAPTLLYGVVRGTDSGIYVGRDLLWSGSFSWTKLPGATSGAPAAVQCGGQLYLAVQGTNNKIYFGSLDVLTNSFSGWTQLSGATKSGPGLATDGWCDLFLAVRGMDNGIYLNTYANPTYAAVIGVPPGWQGWMHLPGATLSSPAVVGVPKTPGSYGFPNVQLAVRGMDNRIYFSTMASVSSCELCFSFTGWVNLGGATYGSPSLAWVFDSYHSLLYLAVEGTDHGIYWNELVGVWGYGPASWSGWAKLPAGGTTLSGPALTIASDEVAFMVQGTNNGIYWCRGTWGGSWSTWERLPGATLSSPALVYVPEFTCSNYIAC